MTEREITSTVGFPDLKPEDAFRPHHAADIDDTRTWVDPRGYRLSDRLWSAKAADRAQIEKVLRAGLARGASPLETANALEHLLNPYYQPRRDPDTFRILPKSKQPPGVVTKTPRQGPGTGPFRPRNSGLGSYAARRLARTETTRAFGDATMKAAVANPFVHRMRWRLSGHHHDSDECDQNAERSSRNQPPGVYWLDEVPRYPNHPHEMCTLNPVVIQADIDDAIPRIREYIRTGYMPPPGFRDFDNKPLLPWELLPRTAAPTPPPADPNDTRPQWVRDVADISAREQSRFDTLGTVDEAEIRRAGALVRQNLKPGDPRQQELLRRIAAMREEQAAISRQIDDPDWRRTADFDAKRALYDKRWDIQNQIDELNKEIAAAGFSKNPMGDSVRQTLADVRPMGSAKKHPFATGSNNEAKALVNGVRNSVPTEWWESSIAGTPLRTRMIARGHYSHHGRRGASELNISGWSDAGKADTAMHEFGHRMEYTRPAIRAAEQAFYQRRTAGEELTPLKKLFPGHGYKEHEVVRIDQFAEAYSGKDYGGRAWEIVSMGVEDVYRNGKAPEWIEKDEDYLDFILGVLATL